MRIDNPIISGSLIVSGSTTITGVLSASSFTGDGSGLTGVTSYTDTDTLNFINSINVLSGSIDWNTLEGKPSGIVSSSSQVSFTGITDKPTLVSGSSQIIYSSISNIPTGIISGSGQISSLGFTTCTGTVTSVATGTGLTGGAITSTGTISLSHLGLESLTDPNTDRVAFWDDSAGAFAWLTMGSNLSITDTTLNASGATINNNTDNYVITATGTAGTLNGEANLTFNGSTLSVTGNVVSTGTGTSFRNRIGIGDGNGTPFTNAGSPGMWLSYNGASDQFIGACTSTVWGVYIGNWRMTVTNTGTVTATCFVETSAQKYKTDIETFNCTDYFNCLRPVSFKWKENGSEDIGFIAEELNQYYPTLVAKSGEDEPTGVKYTKIVPLLVKKIQEQDKIISDLDKKLNDIYSKINKDI